MQGFWSKNLFLKYPLMGEKKRNLQAEGILLTAHVSSSLLERVPIHEFLYGPE